MKRIARILIVSLIAATCAYSQAPPEWKVFTTNAAEESVYSFNRKRLKLVAADVRETWVRERFEKAHKESYEARLMLIQVNCNSIEIRTLNMTYYDGDGNTIRHVDFVANDTDRWVAAAPQTIGDQILTVVCNEPLPELDDLFTTKPKTNSKSKTKRKP